MEQAANSKWPLRIMINGQERLLVEIARENGIQPHTVWCRIRDYGWTPEAAATTPAHATQERIVEFRGERRRVMDFCRQLGVSKSMVLYRLDRGWSVEDALTKPSRRVLEAANKTSNPRWRSHAKKSVAR
jgi:hypothetical protein